MILKQACILDLDNTIYPVSSIGDALFDPLLLLIRASGQFNGDEFLAVKHEVMRKPFQVVAKQFSFSKQLTKEGTEMLKELTYEGPVTPFPDYQEVRKIAADRFLVTTGFLMLQQSKISGMQLEKDFKEIHIIDPLTSALTKKDVFADILERNNYKAKQVVVIGDDPDSEIKAALELGIDAVLYDRLSAYPDSTANYRITDFGELEGLFN